MDRQDPHLLMSASARVLIPIVGMLGGLGLGAIASSLRGTNEIDSLARVIRWGVTGFFLGLMLVVLVSVSLARKDLVSLRRLMVLVLIAGWLSWFFARILFGVIGY